MSKVIQIRQGVYAVENPAINYQLGVDSIVRDLVLGTPQYDTWPGQLILPDRFITTIQSEYPVFGTEHLDIKDAKRAIDADIKTSGFALTMAQVTTERYSWAIVHDTATIRNSDAIGRVPRGLRVTSQAMARRHVEMAVEYEKKQALMDVSAYPSGQSVDLTGSEWNSAGGDIQANVHAVAGLMGSTNLLSVNSVWLVLDNLGWRAAQRDPVWRSTRIASGNGNAPSLAGLAEYLGIAGVELADVRVKNDAGTIQGMYETQDDGTAVSGVGFLYVKNPATRENDQFGMFQSGATFRWTDTALNPQPVPFPKTQVAFPWETWAKPAMFGYTNLGLFYDVYKASGGI